MSDPQPGSPRGPSSEPTVVIVHDFPPTSSLDVHAAEPSLGEALLKNDAKTNVGLPTPRVDQVQEEVMTVISPDGRPPHRAKRLAEWRWFVLGAVVLVGGGMVWAGLSGVSWPMLLSGAAIVLVFMGAAIPVWGSGLLRGGEERVARKAALVSTHRIPPVL